MHHLSWMAHEWLMNGPIIFMWLMHACFACIRRCIETICDYMWPFRMHQRCIEYIFSIYDNNIFYMWLYGLYDTICDYMVYMILYGLYDTIWFYMTICDPYSHSEYIFSIYDNNIFYMWLYGLYVTIFDYIWPCNTFSIYDNKW